jgi:hypothetical protein
VTIDRPADVVHRFLAQPESWPRWAVVNILAVEPTAETEWWDPSTPDGPAQFRIRADAATGIVDHDFRFDDELATVPARVAANGRGADFVVTIVQPSDVTDGGFRALLESVDTELATLKALFESDHTA